MAAAFCRRCQCAANEVSCPNCGSAMLSDEDFTAFSPKTRPPRPSFFDPAAERKENLQTAIRELEKKFNQKGIVKYGERK